MNILSEKFEYVIMSKDREFIAKGQKSWKQMIRIHEETDRKGIIIYRTKGAAENVIKDSIFAGLEQLNGYLDKMNPRNENFLEAVKIKTTLSFE